MDTDTRERTARQRGLVGHLEQALRSTDQQTKNYHIRQALQLYIGESDSL